MYLCIYINTVLGSSWAVLMASWGRLQASSGLLGVFLGAYWAIFRGALGKGGGADVPADIFSSTSGLIRTPKGHQNQ